jgi:hypothetical protein
MVQDYSKFGEELIDGLLKFQAEEVELTKAKARAAKEELRYQELRAKRAADMLAKFKKNETIHSKKF